jgi:hypothetical protein
VSDPDAPPLDPQALLAAFERHQVAFVAVGGVAAQWHGAQRPTKDLDVCPAWDAENLERLAAALRDLGARLRVPNGPSEGLEVPIDGALLARMEVGTWRTQAGDVDLLLGIPCDSRWNLARFEELQERAVLVDIGDATVMAATLRDIVRSKEIADRPPDRQALPELRRLRDSAAGHDD